MKAGKAAVRFHDAIECLIGPESQRERLREAYSYYLTRLDPVDLPEEIRDRFVAFESRITRCDGPGGTVPASIMEMSDLEVGEMCHEIHEMYHAVLAAFDEEARQ
jgi:hypothetical protein